MSYKWSDYTIKKIVYRYFSARVHKLDKQNWPNLLGIVNFIHVEIVGVSIMLKVVIKSILIKVLNTYLDFGFFFRPI